MSRGALRHLSPAGWLWLGGSIAAAALLWTTMLVAAAQPPYAAIPTGAGQAQVSRATATLDRYGIPWELTNNGQQLAVPKAKAAQAEALVAPHRRGAGATGLQAGLQRLLDTTLGPGKASVVVNVQLNRNQATQSRLAYAGRGVALATARQSAPGFRAGSTAWGVSQAVTTTQFAPGGVTRENVALLVDRSVPRRTVGALRRTVAAAAGITPARGDRLTVGRVRMPPAGPAAAPGPLGWAATASGRALLGYARWLALAVGLLAFVVTAAVRLRRAESAVIATT